MDVAAELAKLNTALRLQYRSALQYTLTSGSIFGLEFQGLGAPMWDFGRLELEDSRLLVEKIASLGGEPTTEVAELDWSGEPGEGRPVAHRDGVRGRRGAQGRHLGHRSGGALGGT